VAKEKRIFHAALPVPGEASIMDKPVRNAYGQFKALIPVMLLAYLPTLAALIGISFFALATGRRIWFFTVEPFLLGHLPFYAGILSIVGNLLWAATAAVCFFTAWLLGTGVPSRPWKRFLSISGLLTSLLLIDGLFQMHRIFYPKYAHLTTVFVYALYGVLVLGYLGYFRKQIRETDFLLLALALIFFILAVIFDTFSILPRGATAFSDGLKLFGIVSWFTYFIRTCRMVLRR
jgi:hypothetical protein